MTIAKAPSKATPVSNFFFMPDLLEWNGPSSRLLWDGAPSGRMLALTFPWMEGCYR